MIKLIGLDLDGTLLNDDGSVSEKNRQAIEKARKNGIHVCIVSGRNEESIRKTVYDLGLEDERHIAANGAMLVDYENGHEDLFTIDEDTYRRFYTLMKKTGRQFMPMNRDGYYYDEDAKEELYDVIRSWIDEKSLVMRDLEDVRDCYRISILWKGEKDLEDLKRILPDTLYGNVDRNVYDTRPAGVSKLEGMKKLTKSYGIDISDAAFIGDQASDIEILDALENSFAPKNSEREAIESASTVLERTNNEGAVWEMIMKHLL